MKDNFKIEIISPEKIIFSDDIKVAKIPSYEGDMSILNDHISIITFLRPGIIRLEKKDGNFEDFFAEDGTVEFFNNSLVLLSASIKNLKDLSKEVLDNLNKDALDKLSKNNLTDQERYVLNHKLEAIKEIRI